MPTNSSRGISPLTTVGVLADTHIPDRKKKLHPQVIPAFKTAGVDMILHAGDICLPSVIHELEKVAPVYAVRGNRDLIYGRIKPKEVLEIAGICVLLIHGHGNLFQYASQKIKYQLHGYQLEHYLPGLLKVLPSAGVIVFGHTHHPICLEYDGRLIFNPGSAGLGWMDEIPPSVGLLRFYLNSVVNGEIIYMETEENIP